MLCNVQSSTANLLHCVEKEHHTKIPVHETLSPTHTFVPYSGKYWRALKFGETAFKGYWRIKIWRFANACFAYLHARRILKFGNLLVNSPN